eukprot:INCI9181.4.p1 GENE.INCI9181.4~~INCI9181.4.p1  ORF type:complete len:144 (-),score=42.64 INCI9181.4:244-675(-)
MRAFAVSKMPSFVERVKTTKNLDDFLAKADKFNLPKILLFTNKKNSDLKPVYKALSTEYRRRVLVAHVKESATDAKEILKQFGLKKFPALIAVGAGHGGDVVDSFKKKSSWNALNTFFFENALPKPYFDMPKEDSKGDSHSEL